MRRARIVWGVLRQHARPVLPDALASIARIVVGLRLRRLAAADIALRPAHEIEIDRRGEALGLRVALGGDRRTRRIACGRGSAADGRIARGSSSSPRRVVLAK